MTSSKSKLILAFAALALGGCAHSSTHQSKADSAEKATLQVYTLTEAPVIGQRKNGQPIKLGGFSGLVFEKVTPTEQGEKYQFLTHTDRGPNDASTTVGKVAKGTVIFPLPEFQPAWIRVVADPRTHALEVLEQVPLRKKDGGKVTGLPNKVAKSGGSGTDENPVNAEGKSLRPDPYGLDTESLVIAADGSVWMGEEYRPSIIHFSRDGRMIDRFVPQNSGGKKKGAFGVEALPEIYSSRRLNRGFEALAMKEGRLYAFPQSPLEPAASDANQARTKSRAVRVLQFDPQTQKATGEFVYLLDEQGDDRKLGDAIALPDGDFLVLEQTSDPSPNADKKLYRVSFDRATNLLAKNDSKRPVETLTAQEMQAAGVEAAQKTLVVDLVHMPGLEHYVFKGKLEGLAVIDPDTIAVVNDNDFGMFSDEKSELLLIRKKDLLKPPASSAP